GAPERPPRVSGRVRTERLSRPYLIVAALPGEPRIRYVAGRVHALHIGLHQRAAVHAHPPPPHLDRVPRDADHALDVVLLGIPGIGEDHDLAAPRAPAARDPCLGAGNLGAAH